MIKGENTTPLIKLYLGVIIMYFLVKYLVRPYVLTHKLEGFIKIFVLSVPNFCEAVAGTVVTTALLLWINALYSKRIHSTYVSDLNIYISSAVMSGAYVLLQEFKIHNLGGVNVYDPYDVYFSIVGLVIVFIIILTIKPKIEIV